MSKFLFPEDYYKIVADTTRLPLDEVINYLNYCFDTFKQSNTTFLSNLQAMVNKHNDELWMPYEIHSVRSVDEKGNNSPLVRSKDRGVYPNEYDHMELVQRWIETKMLDKKAKDKFDYFKQAFEVIEKRLAKPIEQKHITFQWKGTFEGENNQLTTLYSALYNSEMIKCSENVFKGVFGKSNFIEPIKWLGKNERLFTYLLDKLKEYLDRDSYEKRFSIAEKCFYYNIIGDIDNAQLARAKDGYKNNKSGLPKDHKDIDSIIASL